MNHNINTDEIKRFIAGREFEIAKQLEILIDGGGKEHKQYCPFCKGESGERFYIRTGEKTSFHCRQKCFNGDLFALVMKSYSVDFNEAKRLIANAAGYVGGATHISQPANRPPDDCGSVDFLVESPAMNPAVYFIINRAVADYVRLYKAGNAPTMECYARCLPEYAETLIHELLFAEYKLRREKVPTFSVEAFIQEHLDYCNNEHFVARLIDYERATAKEEPKPQPKQEADVTVDFQPPKEHVPDITDAWTPGQAKSIVWTVQSPQQDADITMDFHMDSHMDCQMDCQVETIAPDITMDFQMEMDFQVKTITPDETVDFQLPATTQPATAPPARPTPPVPAKSENLPEMKIFTVSDTLMVEKFLGSGYWKDVYKAKQQSTKQYVALKHLRENNEVERQALTREVRTQAMLTHQNIPPVFAMNVLPSGQAIVVEKLVDGSRWSDTIKARTLDDNLRILLDVAQALAFAHRQHKIIHRDLKPDNVVINDKYNEVYVIDWGLAVDVSDEPSGSDDLVPHVSELEGMAGTPLYWAPELSDGNPTRCSPATDVFLLGALLYEILTGYAPYRVCNPNVIKGLRPEEIEEIRSLEVGAMLRAVRGIIIPPRLFAPNRYIPDELVAIALKSMSLSPNDRYADAGDFIDAIKQYQHFSLVTSRCENNWKQFSALCRERDRTLDQPDAQLSLTLRFLETSDIFRGVASDFQLKQIASEISSGMHTGSFPAVHPTLLSAQQGEVEARTELIALTLRSGDLTLANAQIGLIEQNPFHEPGNVRAMRNQVRTLQGARHRARMMKWVAVGLLAVFLGSSVLYGYLINEQYKETTLQYHRAEENFHRAEENFQRAEENFRQARNAVNEFFTAVARDDDFRNAPGLMQLRRTLFDTAKRYYEDFVLQRSDDPDVIAGQIGTLFDMAEIVTHFGERYDAIDFYLRAIALGEELVQQYPNNPHYLDLLAKCYKDLGVVYGRLGFPFEQILDSYLKALPLNRRLVAEFGDVPEYHRNLARILHNLGALKATDGTDEEAIRYFRESLAVRSGMARFDDPPEFHFGQAQTHLALALLYVKNGLFDDADREFEMASHFLVELREIYPDRFRNDEIHLLGSIYFGRGEMVFDADKPEMARTYLLRAIDTFGILVENSPEHVGYQWDLNNALFVLLECLEDKHEAAGEVFQQYGFEPLDFFDEDRTPEEEERWRQFRTRLREVLEGR